MQRALLFITLLSPSVVVQPSTSTPTSTEVNGQSQDRNNLNYNLPEICTRSGITFFDRMKNSPHLFSNWIAELNTIPGLQRVEHYFHPRPVDTPRSSMCQPMNTTCCRQLTEKHMVKLAQREYGELFLNVTHENIRNCFVVGRYFHHAIYLSFSEMRRQFEIPINAALDKKLPSKFFDDFFSYLSSFLITSDLCQLTVQLKTVMFKFFNFIYDIKDGENLRQTHSKCYRNVSMQIMENIFEEIFNKLERQLYNLDLIFRAMQMSEIVLQRIARHQFSSECIKPLTQLQNCAHCTGYFEFKPCLFYCINVFRGCFADVAGIHQEFQLMIKALSDIPDEILPSLEPAAFIRSSLHYFLDLAEDLRNRDLKHEVAEACTDNAATIRRRRSVSTQRQPATTAHTPTFTQELNRQLEDAFNRELECMENIGSLLKTIPEEMCYLSKEHKTVADTGNHRCWTGSRMGTYRHSEVPSSREAQVNNPEFRGGPLLFLNQFADLNMDISMVTAEINETLDLVLCLDDEDCSATPFYVCEEDDPGLSFRGSGFGSGSGSGSGSASGKPLDDGMRDMEDGDSSDEDASVNGPQPDLGATTTLTDFNSISPPLNESTDDTYTVIDILNNASSGSGSTDTTTTTATTLQTPETTDTTHVTTGATWTPDSSGDVPDILSDDDGVDTVISEGDSATGVEVGGVVAGTVSLHKTSLIFFLCLILALP